MKLDHGTVTPVYARADRGETVTVTVTPDDNFMVKKGTLKAVVKARDGSYTSEVYMNRSNDTTYTFVMPSTIEDVNKVEITFVGEFEPGQSDSTAFETSLGAGVAVSVVSSENRATVKGSVSSGKNVRLNAILNGSAKTETKAGYSKSNIGVGGAVAVQVASMNSKSLIYKGANVALDGKLSVGATGNVNYNVNADASGNKEAGEVGVGAAIAVAVDGSDVFAAVQDGAKLANRTSGKNIRAISLSARQEIHDSVTAKAGAAGRDQRGLHRRGGRRGGERPEQ